MPRWCFSYSLILSLEVAFVTVLGPNGAGLGEVIACIRRRRKKVVFGGGRRKKEGSD
jgi:hypothetical protein